MNERTAYANRGPTGLAPDVTPAQTVTALLLSTAKRLEEANAVAMKIIDRLRGPEPASEMMKGMPAENSALGLATENEIKVSRLLSQLDQISSAIG